jgi:hypothetical protein
MGRADRHCGKYVTLYWSYTTPASFSFDTSSSTEPTYPTVNTKNLDVENRLTFAPPCRFGGSVTLMVCNRGWRSTPSSSAVTFSIGFFFAFMMLGNEV